MPNKPHVSDDFHSMSAEKRADLAGTIRNGIRDNPTLFDYTKTPKPPLTIEAYTTIIDAAISTRLIYKQGGRAQKPDFLNADALEMATMDLFAVYVDEIADGDEGIIIKSGFNVADSKGPAHKQTIPGTPTVIAVRGAASGEIDTQSESFGGDSMYGCIISEGKPLVSEMIIFHNSQFIVPAGYTNRIIQVLDIHRKKKIMGLTKGVTYFIYYYVANTAGVSQLSIGVEIMCA